MFTLENISYRVTEEYNLVANPIYNISIQHTANNPQQETITSTTTAARGDEAVTYEKVSNVRRNKPNASISDTLAGSQLGTDEDEASQNQ